MTMVGIALDNDDCGRWRTAAQVLLVTLCVSLIVVVMLAVRLVEARHEARAAGAQMIEGRGEYAVPELDGRHP